MGGTTRIRSFFPFPPFLKSDVVYPRQDLHRLLLIGAFDRIGVEHGQVDLGIVDIIGEDYRECAVISRVESRSLGIFHNRCPVVVREVVNVVEPVEVTASALSVSVQIHHVFVEFHQCSS